ncbi:hypothetical protein N665_0383s0120 [Sinapis alba]|nr:hypothetical protein N665_0383s0120 [Sinapis alba]
MKKLPKPVDLPSLLDFNSISQDFNKNKVHNFQLVSVLVHEATNNKWKFYGDDEVERSVEVWTTTTPAVNGN